jgi:UDP-galactopyranose mutase
MTKKRILIVGSGFYGSTLAHLLSDVPGTEILIVEAREHIGGNAYSYVDEHTGIEVHKYGSHLFHTDSEKIWNFINRFSKFNNYRHKVITRFGDQYFPMPINLMTISSFYGKTFSPDEARAKMQTQGSVPKTIDNLEEKAISLIGEDLYLALIKGYTWKQWQTPPNQLPSDIITRLPVRFDFEDSYFTDRYQGLPIDGYSSIFHKMLDKENIQICLNTNFFDMTKEERKADWIIFTGPIDRFFEFKYGELGWRTLDFQWEYHDSGDYQGTSVINEADIDVEYTRTHEFRHLHPERDYPLSKTVIAREFSRMAQKGDEPYYPINTEADRGMLEKYRNEAKKQQNMTFGGRLGRYQYLDMHMAIGAAFKDFETILKNL